MADPTPFVALGLHAIDPVVNHYHKAWHPIKRKVKKIPVVRRSRSGDYQKDYVYDEEMTPEQKGWVLKPRKEVGSDEEIMEYVGKRSSAKGNELVPRQRPGGMIRRTSSVDRGSQVYRWAKGGAAANYAERHDDSSDDEVDRRSRRGRAKSNAGRSRGNTTELRSQSTSSSSICSSSEDERNERKIKRKTWLTAGLATVATIHAAQKVYSSLEARDKRTIEVATGKLSPDEARKQQNSARWQDAAAVGIAALGIKGAFGEWHEMSEQRQELKKQREEREERHQKRVQRAIKAKERGVDYKDMLHPHSRGQNGQNGRDKSARGNRDDSRNGYDDRRNGDRNGDRGR